MNRYDIVRGIEPDPEMKMAELHVKNARSLEDKALKCIAIAQKILPYAPDNIIENQAVDLMHLPDEAIFATLQRINNLSNFRSSTDVYGSTGVQGYQGTTGIHGYQGTPGPVGYTGIQG